MVSSPWQLVASGQNHSGMWITLFMVITPLPMFFSVLFYSCFNSADGILEISFGKNMKVWNNGIQKRIEAVKSWFVNPCWKSGHQMDIWSCLDKGQLLDRIRAVRLSLSVLGSGNDSDVQLYSTQLRCENFHQTFALWTVRQHCWRWNTLKGDILLWCPQLSATKLYRIENWDCAVEWLLVACNALWWKVPTRQWLALFFLKK